MTLRHLAALALVGWYLIMPPVRNPPHQVGYADSDAPLREWERMEKFNNRDDCEDALDQAISAARNGRLFCLNGGFCGVIGHGEYDSPSFALPWYVRQEDSQCIASDDPRLKEK